MRNARLPDIRCSQSEKAKIMAHANNKSMTYSDFVLNLIANDMKVSSEPYSQPKNKESLVFVGFHIPGSLRDYLRAVKEDVGISMSEQVRKILLEHHGVRDLDARELDELIRLNNQLIAVGRNLNQLTRVANSNRAVQIPEQLIARLLDAIDRANGDLTEIKDRLGI